MVIHGLARALTEVLQELPERYLAAVVRVHHRKPELHLLFVEVAVQLCEDPRELFYGDVAVLVDVVGLEHLDQGDVVFVHLLSQFVECIYDFHARCLELFVVRGALHRALVYADLAFRRFVAGHHRDVIAHHHGLEFTEGDRVTLIRIKFLEYIPLLLRRQRGINSLHKLLEMLELQLRILMISMPLKQPL